MRSITICTDLKTIRQDIWDSVVTSANGSVFYTWSWLHSYEMAAPHASHSYHVLAFEGSRLIGILPAYLTRGCPRLESHRKYVVSRETTLREPMLLAHTFYSYYGGPLVAADANDAASVRQELVDALARLAHDLGVTVYGIINVPNTEVELLKVLQERRYAVRYLSSTMTLPLQWDSYNAYLAHLNGKRRRLICADERKVVARGVTAELVYGNERIEDLVELARGILLRHGHRDLDLFPPSYLSMTVRELGNAAPMLHVRGPDGRTLCFFLMLSHESRLTPWVAGIDYSTLRTYEPYHFAYRWVISYAITHGYREIDMGRGSYRFKQRYGFLRRPLYFALNTTRIELREEVERWSADLAENALIRYRRQMDNSDQPSELVDGQGVT